MGPPAARRPRPRLLPDIYNGAVWGEFAVELGPAGAFTLTLLAFVPVIGTLCALRDLVASLYHVDGLGALLNALALVPVLGGVSKTAEVLRHARVLSRGVTGRKRGDSLLDPYTGVAASGPKNTIALISFEIGLLIPVLAPWPGIALIVWVIPHLALDFRAELLMVLAATLVLPVLAIVTGHVGLRRARQWKSRAPRRALAVLGLVLGYLYLTVFVAVAALIWILASPTH